jgi:hypothetical protein
MAVGKAVGLDVKMGAAVCVGIAVGVAGMGVLLGTTVIVNGSAVSVNGSVGYGVTVLTGKGVDGRAVGVRVAVLGTQRSSPTYIMSLVRQFTLFSVPALV